MSQRVTLLGTGLMGAPMARNLLAGEVALSVWNRSPAKAAALEPEGARAVPELQKAVQGADFVISMVLDGPAMLDLVAQALPHLGKGTLWIDMSSTRPAEAREAAERLEGAGCHFIDAPVSGGVKAAEEGTLAIMAGGAEGDIARAAPILLHLGRATRVGPVGAGQLAKLANQAIVGITITAVAEATLLLEKGGADPAAVRDALAGGFADSVILQQHGARISDRNFAPGGPSRIQLKDMNNVLKEAATVGLRLPAVEHVRDRYARYVNELDGGGRDHAGIYEELRDSNALDD